MKSGIIQGLTRYTTSDYAYIMEAGKIVLEGPSKELRENPDVKEFYLGVSEGGGRKSNLTNAANAGCESGEFGA